MNAQHPDDVKAFLLAAAAAADDERKQEAYRWMHAKSRWLQNNTHVLNMRQDIRFWWYTQKHVETTRPGCGAAVLPPQLLRRMGDQVNCHDDGQAVIRGFTSALAAFEALAEAWCRLTDSQRARCWSWRPKPSP